MLAPRQLPDQYHEWNRRWHAPQGPDGQTCLPISTRITKRRARALGPFVWQPNTSTRAFEYPWAYFSAGVTPGQRVLEIGGALSGLQFALAHGGAAVVNVDPLLPYGGTGSYGGDTPGFHRWLNEVHDTDVVLLACTIEEAALPSGSFDTALCISTIEHLDPEAVKAILAEVARVLKPGGTFVLTVDLFLNLVPFTARTTNDWGENVSVRALAEMSELELDIGNQAELFGYDDFDPERILATLERYAIGTGYPQLAQAFSLRRPAAP